MIIVAGHIQVPPGRRTRYLDGCREVVRQARQTEGCEEFALSADLLDPGRINVFERWTSVAAVEAFRGSGPAGPQAEDLIAANVEQFTVSTSLLL